MEIRRKNRVWGRKNHRTGSLFLIFDLRFLIVRTRTVLILNTQYLILNTTCTITFPFPKPPESKTNCAAGGPDSDDGKIQTIAGADISFNKYRNGGVRGHCVAAVSPIGAYFFFVGEGGRAFSLCAWLSGFSRSARFAESLGTTAPKTRRIGGGRTRHRAPAGMGIAAHFGTLTGQRSMGCAKKILCGTYEEPDRLKNRFYAHPPQRRTHRLGRTLQRQRKTRFCIARTQNEFGRQPEHHPGMFGGGTVAGSLRGWRTRR